MPPPKPDSAVADRAGPPAQSPAVYSIAAHRGFADALVAGLLPRYAETDFGLARLTLLLPSQRAARTVTEAFVRISGEGGQIKGGARGLLLPRMAVVGDLDLDETLGPLLDPLGAGEAIPPAADPVRRWLRLAEILRAVDGDRLHGAALLRQAHAIAQTMDRLLVEGVAPIDLLSETVIGLVGEQAEHWQANVRTFLKVQQHWIAECGERGEVDPPTRRNLLFDRAAKSWRDNPPPHPVVAAGVTSASPSLARLLRVVAETPRGAVILPDLDLALEAEVWAELGTAGQPASPEDPPFGRADAVTHPQYHLKLLLNRMGLAREEVRPWHRAGMAAAPPARSKAISSLFLPPFASTTWADLPDPRRRLAGVRLMESAHPGAEAQAIAVLMREALETPERRVALVTPDRALASRVVAHLQRWGIDADDTAGRALPLTAAGRLLLLLAEVMGEGAAPVPLVALLSHPLVMAGEGRAPWLDHVRTLDVALRGPRPAPGLAPLAEIAARRGERLAKWWGDVSETLAPLLAPADETPLADLLDTLATAAEALCGERLWGGADGRSLAAFLEALREPARDVGTRLHPRDLAALLRERMDTVSVRPPWGKHPRVAIYGLIEARMSRADLVICGSLVEGTWPGAPSPDPLLPPAVLRQLGIPGADFRIGLSAHDLAAALGAPEVVLSWSRRDESGPAIPSRFVLRVQAMLGDLAAGHAETEAPRLAAAIDEAPLVPPHPRPQPMPGADQRRIAISATNLDRLRSDPYQFYANAILRLSSLDALDADPNAPLRGIAAHAILDRWHRADGNIDDLRRIAAEELDTLSAHPLLRALWRPRLLAALEWIAGQIELGRAEGRTVAGTELWGEMLFDGIRVHGRADRIDTLPDGTLAVIDYKTGGPPTNRMVQEGFSLQLGTLGLIAANGRFKDRDEGIELSGTPTRFEYWSLARDKNRDQGAFGYRQEPILEDRKKTGIPRDEFLSVTAGYLKDAIDRWINGAEPFTARLNPQLGTYADYDQLMRLEEWFWTMDRADAEAAS
ncbi:MAG: double-strand break repair protein AddB [Sphingomonadales bacterium]|nr:double-strand break repair protein AddB [Sphingomonadales bacterium]